MAAPFYRAFEDKHRGPRPLIKQRLAVYLPFVAPLAASHPQLPVLDLGCGRGEWLELLQDHHIAAQGVDLDDSMLTACRERGFDVLNADAIAHLAAQPSHSKLAITGFHIAEHLPLDTLQTLLAHAQRILVPGGLLILETPNPENLVVGTANFYLDPTHQRPLPWQLLAFLAEHQGFAPVKVLRLQEEPHLTAPDAAVNLYDVLGNVSPDYAIVARAPADPAQPDAPALARALQRAFDTEYGLSLHTLATRFQAQLHTSQQHTLLATQAAQHDANQAMALARQLTAHTEQLTAHTEQLIAQLHAVYASRSWRLTRPLRWLTHWLGNKHKD